ncbi:MAG: hypothetical protein P4L51_12190 [Puia sp.]|nr:hypothetical protein [Puia sp.]
MPSTQKKTQKDKQGKSNPSNNKDRAVVEKDKTTIKKDKTVITKQEAAAGSGKSLSLPFRGAHYLLNAWVFIPALFYFMLVGQYAANAPIKDDYDAILVFLTDFSHAHSFFEKAALLFRQHNEHRILSTRLLTVFYYTLTGKANFRNLIFIGDLQLIVIFLVSVHFIRRWIPKYWNFIAFVWGLCIFDPSSYENGAVSMTSLQNFGIVMLFLLTLYFYSLEQRKWLIPAAIFQFLCIFSSGNGIPGALLVAIFTLFSKDKWKIATSFTVLLIFSPLYFYHYVSPAPVAGPKQVIALSTAVPYFFQMTGAHFHFPEYSLFYGIGVVVLLFLCLPYGNKALFSKHLLPLLCLLGFVVVTEGLVALIRSSTQIFYASRYLIYPHLLAAIVFLLAFRKLMEKNILWTVIILFCGMVYAYSNNYRYGQAGFERESLRAETLDYYYPDKHRAKVIAANACEAGIYCLQDEK